MVGVGRACLVRFKRDSRGRLCLCLTLIRLVEEAVSLKGGRARCVSSAQSTVVFILSFPFATSRFSLSIAPVRRSITPLRCGLILSFFLCFLALFSLLWPVPTDRHSFRLSNPSSSFQQQPPCFFPNPIPLTLVLDSQLLLSALSRLSTRIDTQTKTFEQDPASA